MDKIQCFEGRYDKVQFYAKMGRFFAEERYIRQMPYLRNESDRIWFVIEKKERVVAFASLRIMDEYVKFTTEYVEAGYRRQGLFHALTNARFDYCRELDMPLRTATNIPFIRDYYIRHGFKIYRTTKQYWFLMLSKEANCEIGQRETTRDLGIHVGKLHENAPGTA